MRDLVFDSLHILRRHGAVVWWILDIVDAFWTLPTRPDEMRFFCGRLRGTYYLFLRIAQGSRGAPWRGAG